MVAARAIGVHIASKSAITETAVASETMAAALLCLVTVIFLLVFVAIFCRLTVEANQCPLFFQFINDVAVTKLVHLFTTKFKKCLQCNNIYNLS